MELIPQGLPFSFNYTAYDLDASLFVGFSLYDVTTGTPVFIQNVTGVYSANGSYVGSFTSLPGKTYLIIGVVYTSDTYATVDTTRGPTCKVYQAAAAEILMSGFAYGAFSQANGLFLQARIYDMTTGAPVFVQTQTMAHVAFGVYFGSFTGEIGHCYQIVQAVYTDNTYETVNTNWPPSTDDFISFVFSNFVNAFNEATLTGQLLVGTLTATNGG